MNLQSLFNTLLKKGMLPPTRVRSLQSSLRRYASLLGYADLASCSESAFNLPRQQRKDAIESLARPVNKRNGKREAFSSRTLANITYDVGFVLKQGAASGLIKARFGSEGFKPTAGSVLFKYPESRHQFRRGETNCLPSVAISEKDLPARLRKELDEYWEWATDEFVLNRPRTRKRRAISAKHDRELLRRIAGFHVKHCGAVAATLSLQNLVDESAAAKYVNWFISHHGRATFTLQNVLISLVSLANYLAIIAKSNKQRVKMTDASRRLESIRERLPDCVAVRDKKKLWLSLEQIEACGINRYPRNTARLATASDAVRQKLQTLNTKGHHSNLKHTAIYALESLLVRLMIRIPLRLRNFCEMSWNPVRPEEGKNLFRMDGSWYVRFSGSELKVGMRRGKVVSILHRVPSELTWLIEEVLTKWRPIITGVPYSLPEEGKSGPNRYQEPPQTKAPADKKAPGNVLLFLTGDCKPATREVIRFWVESTTYAYTGVAVYPHLIRDIWATTYIKETGDIAGAARRLGNTYEITLKHYAHLLDEEAEEKGDAFNRKLFGLNPERDG